MMNVNNDDVNIICNADCNIKPILNGRLISFFDFVNPLHPKYAIKIPHNKQNIAMIFSYKNNEWTLQNCFVWAKKTILFRNLELIRKSAELKSKRQYWKNIMCSNKSGTIYYGYCTEGAHAGICESMMLYLYDKNANMLTHILMFF